MDDQSFKERIERLNRLRGLGVIRGAHHLKTTPKAAPAPPISPIESPHPIPDSTELLTIEEAVAGSIATNEYGTFFAVEVRWPLRQAHGRLPLQDLLHYQPGLQNPINAGGEPPSSWRQVLFLDTETSGLDVAAGTIAFMIGLGWIEEEDFVVRQLFMRDFPEEPAILAALVELAGRFKALATFNGRSFDLPLLENRLVQARLPLDLLDLPHYDLLHPARRLWKARLGSCSLSNLERELLAVERTGQDIPGWAIPDLYRHYLNTGDGRPLAGVFYHNSIDVLSMAALSIEICRCIAPFLPGGSLPSESIHPADALSLGDWFLARQNLEAAEKAMDYALNAHPEPGLKARIMRRLSMLLKRQRRYEQALPFWQELAGAGFAPDACAELAKYYEWQLGDFTQALHWAQEGEKQAWRLSGTRQEKSAWAHRLLRLENKCKDRPVK